MKNKIFTCRDALGGIDRGNRHKSRKSHAQRRRIAQVQELDLELDISRRVNQFASSRLHQRGDSILPDYYDIQMLVYVANYFGSRSILEFGSGCSTAAFAQYASNQISAADFRSIEGDKNWADLNNSILDEIGLPKCIEVCPPELAEVNGIVTYVHTGLNIGTPDFIYLDGPELVEANSSLDIIHQDVAHPDLVIVVDGRDENAIVLTQQLNITTVHCWNIFALNYPSNDKVIISESNKRYSEFLVDFAANIFLERLSL
jgi:predicted O-methyltransferase YrrM